MIGSLRGRPEFALLRSAGQRETAAFLWCTWCPDPELNLPRAAFAVTRAYGSAVRRNRLRRRVKHVLNDLDREGSLPPVLMLFGTRRLRPVAQSAKHHTPPRHHEQDEHVFEPTYQEVRHDVVTMVTSIRTRVQTLSVPTTSLAVMSPIVASTQEGEPR